MTTACRQDVRWPLKQRAAMSDALERPARWFSPEDPGFSRNAKKFALTCLIVTTRAFLFDLTVNSLKLLNQEEGEV